MKWLQQDRLQQVHLWPAPEQEQLLAAALLDGDAARSAYATWRAGIDLDADLPYPLLRLLPLVWHNQHRLHCTDPMMGRLKGVYRRFWCENLALFHALTPTLQALADAGLDLLLLKGAPLVASYYGNPGLRPMADLDVALPLVQIPTALAVLREQGWWTPPPPSADAVRFFHALPCGNGERQLDLHYHLLRECSSDAADAWFWADREPCLFQGVAATQLAPTAALLHTVIHGVRWNPETPVRWIADALIILRQRGTDLDWPRLLDFADQARLTGRLALGLRYLATRFGVVLPEPVLAQLAAYRPGLCERIANRVILHEHQRLFAHPLTKQWVLFADYCALTGPTDPLRVASGFSHYLRWAWGLRGRRELLPAALAGLRRRLRLRLRLRLRAR